MIRRQLSLFVFVVLLASCAIPVRPIAFVEPVAGRDGVYHFTPDKDQEPQVGAGIMGLLSTLGAILPSPYRELVGMLLVGYVGEKRKQGADACHKQTIEGIEKAKADLPPESWKALTTSLASTQDAKTQKLVWDLTP